VKKKHPKKAEVGSPKKQTRDARTSIAFGGRSGLGAAAAGRRSVGAVREKPPEDLE